MAERKCTACGSTELFPFDLVNLGDVIVEGNPRFQYESFACKNCGHIELYADSTAVEKYWSDLKAKEEKAARISELENELAELKKRKVELHSIINDENQTVKAVNQAKQDIVHIDNEIRSTERKIERARHMRPFNILRRSHLVGCFPQTMS